MAKIFVTTKDNERHKLTDPERRYYEQIKPPQFENRAALRAFLNGRPGAISPGVLGFYSSPVATPAS